MLAVWSPGFFYVVLFFCALSLLKKGRTQANNYIVIKMSSNILKGQRSLYVIDIF